MVQVETEEQFMVSKGSRQQQRGSVQSLASKEC
jgi:hypothetical protein